MCGNCWKLPLLFFPVFLFLFPFLFFFPVFFKQHPFSPPQHFE
jgi:hypothetical protein